MPRAISILTIFMLAFLSLVSSVQAHQPHDSIDILILSPTYSIDGIIFTAQKREASWRQPLPMISRDGGVTWDPLPHGMENRSFFKSISISPRFDQDGVIFYTTKAQGVFRSMDRGATWERVGQGMVPATIRHSAISVGPDGNLVVYVTSSEGGMYCSRDLGETWREVLSSTTDILAFALSPEYESDQVIFAGDNIGHILASSDAGRNWTILGRITGRWGFKEIIIAPEFRQNGEIFVATTSDGLLRSRDFGERFQRIDQGFPDEAVSAIALSPDYRQDGIVFATTKAQGVFRSNDHGDSWPLLDVGIHLSEQTREHFRVLRVSDGFAQDQTIFLGTFEGLYQSTDAGETWHRLETRPPTLISGLAVSPRFRQDSALNIITYGGGVYFTEDAGTSWRTANVGIANPFVYADTSAIDRNNNPVFVVGHREEILVTSDLGDLWERHAIPYPPSKAPVLPTDDEAPGSRIYPAVLATSPDFRTDGLVFIGTRHHGLRIADLRHDRWIDGMLGELFITSIAPSPDFGADHTIFVGTEDGDVARSTNGARSWSLTRTGLPSSNYPAFTTISPEFASDQIVLTGTGKGLYGSNDRGETWQPAGDHPLVTTKPIEHIALSSDFGSGGIALVSVRGHGIFRAPGRAWNWERVASELIESGLQITRFAFSPDFSNDSTIFAAADTHVLRSTDRGETWNLVDVGFVRYENDKSPSFHYEGDWIEIETEDSSAGSYHESVSTGAFVEFSFSGSQATWIGRTGPLYGAVDVFLDGVYYTTVDLFSEGDNALVPLLTIDNLDAGGHEVVLIEASGNGTGRVVVDAFDVVRR